MSFLVTWVPVAHSPCLSGPGWQTLVNAPTTITSPLTSAVPYTTERHDWIPLPNHCVLQKGAPTLVVADTFGVHFTGVCVTTVGSTTGEVVDGARPRANADTGLMAGLSAAASAAAVAARVTLNVTLG